MREGRNCEVCGIDITDKKANARTCSPKCRKILFSKRSVGQNGTENGTLSMAEPEHLDINFQFTITTKPNDPFAEAKKKIRTEKYWYNVPIAAVPVPQEGWPEMPEWMNGRQYFLWWKNKFKVQGEAPELHNPFPIRDNVTYYQAGDGSRRWGA